MCLVKKMLGCLVPLGKNSKAAWCLCGKIVRLPGAFVEK